LTAEVLQADAFEALDELDDDSAHAAIVDYPWKFQIQNGTGRFEYRHKTHGTDDNSEIRDPDDENAMFRMEDEERISELLGKLARVLNPGSWVIFMADDRFQMPIRDALKESEFIFRRNWAWTPGRMGMGSYGRVTHYPIPVATLGETERYVTGRGTLYEVKNGRETDYPTGKPVDLYRQLLRSPVLEEGERLLEPFCGSGPGAAVANERGLGYWGCDVDVEAVELARARTKQKTLHGQMTLADGGQDSE